MAALSANPSVQTKTIARYDFKTHPFVVQTAEVIYDAALVGVDSNGDLVAWSDSAGLKFAGITEHAGSSGTTGDDTASSPVRNAVRVDGPILYGVDVTGVTDRDSILKFVYCSTDNPSDLTLSDTTNVLAIGVVWDWRSNSDMDVLLFTPAEYLLQAGYSEVTGLTDSSGYSGTHDDTIAAMTAFTDNTTGTASTTLAAGVGVQQITLPVTLANIADGDVVTTYTPGYKFKILAVDFITDVPVTTGSKASTINAEIGTTNLTGGVISLTSAACTPQGAEVAGTAVTDNNTGAASDTISLEASSTTTFAEGTGAFVITIQNMDTADALASIAARDAVIAQNISDLAQKINEAI